MAAVFPETVTSTWKLGKALEEVMTHLQGKSLETEGFTRTVETIEPRCPNTVVGDTSLFLQFADHQAHTATPSAMDRGYFRTPSAPVQIRPVQVKMLKPIKPNKNSPPSPLDVGTSGLARQLLQVHFHNTLPQAPPANRKLRM